MYRREILRLLGSAVTVGSAQSLVSLDTGVTAVHQSTVYTVQGSGPTILAFDRGVGQYEGLTSSYRVVMMDYPSAELRESRSPAVIEAFTPDRVSADILAVADAVGADRFAIYGFSWGGVAALQLAIRTDRLTALICGGRPPLGAHGFRPEIVVPLLREFLDPILLRG